MDRIHMASMLYVQRLQKSLYNDDNEIVWRGNKVLGNSGRNVPTCVHVS